MIRFFIVALAIYLAFQFLRWIIRLMQGGSHIPPDPLREGEPQKPKEEYKDVKEAHFEELSDKESSQ